MNFVKMTTLASLAVLVASFATAATVTYNTNGLGTGFSGGTSLTLNSTSGVASTLTFTPNGDITSGVPSNINFGNFTLVCDTCTTQALGAGSFFDAFTFDLVVNDVTDGATGKFVGTSTGGALFSDVSQITLTWDPLVLGPGTLNALTGNFGPTVFTTTNFTGIVAPNSGTIPGQSTVEGTVNSADGSAVPEPATFALVGLALLAVGLRHRK